MCTEDTGWWDAEGTFFLSYPVLTDVWDWQFEAIFFFPSEIWGFWCTTIARNQQSSPRSGLQSAFSCFFSLSVMLWKSFPSFLAEGDPDEIRLFWFCILVSSEEMYIPSGFLDMVNIEVFWELLPVGSSCLFPQLFIIQHTLHATPMLSFPTILLVSTHLKLGVASTATTSCITLELMTQTRR